MNDRLSRVEASISDLDRRVRALEQAAAIATVAADELLPPLPTPAVVQDTAIAFVTFVGRTFVALGGGYLLRALTDSAILPLPLGVGLGFTYAAVWIAACDRAGARGRRVSAAFHALVASLVAFPLVWEAAVRFRIFDAASAAIVLTLCAAAAIGVAIHRQLQLVAWIAVMMAVATAFALMAPTGSLVPSTVALTMLGAATLWLGYTYEWIWLRWPVAFAADLAVFALTVRASAAVASDPAAEVIAAQMLLLNAYLGSIVVRTILRARDVIPFEVVQSAAALALGFGGAVYVAQHSGSGADVLALINLAFGLGCYGVAFVFVERRQDRPRNFLFYSSLALLLVVVSSVLLLDSVALSVVCAVVAVAAAWIGSNVGRLTLAVHSAAYLLVAAASSGLLRAATIALGAPDAASWPAFEPAAMATLAAAGACWAAAPDRADRVASRIPRLLIGVVFVWSAAGWLVATAARLLAVPDVGAVATIRTTVLAAAAIALAWAGRRTRWREAAWLLYPVLAAGGIKLLLEDLPRSRPATLFVALAVYGGALIAAPRLNQTAHRY